MAGSVTARGSSLAKLLRFGAGALLPSQASNGRWTKPLLSARVAAKLRKDAFINGREWTYDSPKPPSDVYERGLKGHKADRDKPLRDAQVAAGLAKQPELAAARAKAKLPKIGPESYYESEVLTLKEIRLKARGAVANPKGKGSN